MNNIIHEPDCNICIRLEYLFSDIGDYSNYEIKQIFDYYHNNDTLSIIKKSSKSILYKKKLFRWNPSQTQYLLKQFEEYPRIGMYDLYKNRINIIRNKLFNMDNKNRIINNSNIKSWFKNQKERTKKKYKN